MLQRLLNQGVNGPMAKKKQKRVITDNVAPDRAEALGQVGASSRSIRDGLTRVQNYKPIRGTETMARQWNRYTP